jgi:hypothetical protein
MRKITAFICLCTLQVNTASAQEMISPLEIEMRFLSLEEKERVLNEEIWPDFKSSVVEAVDMYIKNQSVRHAILADLLRFSDITTPIIKQHDAESDDLKYIIQVMNEQFCDEEKESQFSAEKCLDLLSWNMRLSNTYSNLSLVVEAGAEAEKILNLTTKLP